MTTNRPDDNVAAFVAAARRVVEAVGQVGRDEQVQYRKGSRRRRRASSPDGQRPEAEFKRPIAPESGSASKDVNEALDALDKAPRIWFLTHG